MPSETIAHFYNEIVFLVDKIGELGVSNKFIEAAKTQNQGKIEEIQNQLEVEHPELWTRMFNLYEDYVTAGNPKIFGRENTEEYYKYNPSKVNPLNLCFLCMFSEYDMSDGDLFGTDWDILTIALLENGHSQIAYLTERSALGSLMENLIEAFGEDNH